MTPACPFTRAEFDQLVDEHRQIIRAVNALELQLYRLGDAGGDERATACQQAAGELIGLLRTLLFRYDQQILPQLESRIGDR